MKAGTRFALTSAAVLVPLFAGCVQRIAGQSVVLIPTIRTVAGNGTQGNGADGIAATASAINGPQETVVDRAGNIYFDDFQNARVRRVDAITGIVNTVVGTGTTGYNGDGIAANKAQLNNPEGLGIDAAGNLYIADKQNCRIRKVVATGLPATAANDYGFGNISTIAGNGTCGYTNGVATTSELNTPTGVAVDLAGNVYIADAANNRIRLVSGGNLSTIAGNGANAGSTGDNGQATAAGLSYPYGVRVDPKGNIYFSDEQGNRIRRIDATTKVITTVAGTGTQGFAGDGAAAVNALLYTATPPNSSQGGASMEVDPIDDLYIADKSNQRIRYVDSNSKIISTIAGNGTQGVTGDNGPATSAEISQPQKVTYLRKTGSYLESEYAGEVIREIFTTGPTFPSTPVGTQSAAINMYIETTAAVTINSITTPTVQGGTQEFKVGTVTGCTVPGANQANVICTVPLTFTPAYPGERAAPVKVITSTGTAYFAVTGFGTGPQAIIFPATVSAFAGTGAAGFSGDSGAATAALLAQPGKSSVDYQGNVYIADTTNNVIRMVAVGTGTITTVAGNGTVCSTPTSACGDGASAKSANLNAPRGVSVDRLGRIFIADTGDNRIRIVDPASGNISTYAGTGTSGYTGDLGLANAATFKAPAGVTVDAFGNIYVADTGNNVVRQIDTGTLFISTMAGTGAACATPTTACGDAGAATSATLSAPLSVAVDASSNLYIADTGDNKVRMVSGSTGMISTVVGTGTVGYTGDGAAATNATLKNISDISVDSAGNLYLADSGNNAVRFVGSATGSIMTIAGSAAACASPTSACGDGGISTSANFKAPNSVSLDLQGNIYISDTLDNRVRELSTSLAALNFVVTPIDTTSSDSPKTEYLQNIGNTALTLKQPGTGANPSISTGFTESNTQSCPQLTASTGTLAIGANCSYIISFSPTSIGTYTGSLVETDNSLNAAAATQTVALSGVSTEDNPTVALTTSPNPSTFGSAVTLTATVNGNGTAPTGTVSFYSVGATQIINLDATSTTASSQTLMLPAGTYSISLPGTAGGGTYNGWNPAANPTSNGRWTDRYGVQLCASCATNQLFDDQGTGGNDPSFASDTAALAGYQATPQFGSSANGLQPSNAEVGNPYVFTLTSPQSVTLSVPDPGSFGDDTGGLSLALTSLTAIATGNLNGSGVATATTSALPVGTTPIVAIYNGDANHVTAESAVVNQVVNRAGGAGTDTLTSTTATPTFGAPVTFTDTIPEVNGVCPTGPATFTYTTTGNATPVTLGTGTVAQANPATTPATCVATLTTSALPVGTDSVIATTPQDANYATSTSNTLTETVGQVAGASDTLTANPTSSMFGAPVLLTFTVPNVAGASAPPTGTVTFKNGTTTLGTATLTTTGTGANAVTTATLTTSTLPVGTDTITATYPGDTNYAAANPAPTATETVTQATPAASLAASPATGDTYGAPVVLTETVTPINGTCPTSTVTFASGGTTLGTATFPAAPTGTPATCTATVTTTALPVGTDTVTAMAPTGGNFSAISSSTTETVAVVSGANDKLTANPTSSNFGTPVLLTFTVPTVAGAANPPTGTVTFTSGGITLGTATLSTTGTGANAVTTATLSTSTLPVGTDTITATYPGNANYAAANPAPTATETVGVATPTATLTASPATGDTYGAPVVLTETVTAINGVCPTSTVTFASGGTTLGTATFPATPTGTPATCTATITTTALPVGTDTVTAMAPAGGSYAAISSNTTETVATAAGASDTLTANPTSSMFGAPVVLTFTVPNVAGASAPPTGTVTFKNGTTTLGTGTLTTTGTGANAVTTATLTTSTLPVGTDTITATYPGDTNYAAANPAPTATETVTQATPAASLAASPATGDTYGAPVVLTETVTPINGTCPTSTVTFASGGTTLGSATFPATPTGTPATCTATVSTTALPVGTDIVTATAPAGGNFSAISSSTTETVATASGASDTLTANPTSSTFGSPVNLIFTVPTVAGASSSPTGTVTFTSGGVTLGTATLSTTGTGANAVTTATLTTSTLPVGTDTITANYPGNANYAAASPAPTATETVSQAAPTASLTASPATGDTFGAPVVLTETVTPINGACPTSTVTFASGGVTLGTATFPVAPTGTPATCTATITTTALPVGADTVTATAPAAGNFGAISSSTTETVAAASGANDTLTANPTSSAFGSSVILTFTVPTVAGASAPPTGTVTFTSGGVTLGTGTLSTTGTGANAVTTATLTTSALPVGTDTITANYPGNANYGAANPAPTATETVGPVTPTASLAASPSTGDTFGAPVTLTETVTPVNGACPTSAVTFTSGGTTLGTAAFPSTPTGTPATCTATLTTTALPVGNDTITATAPAGGNFGAISSSTTETVAATSGTGDTLTANPTSSAFGSPVILTFTVPTVAGASTPPTGTITFTSGGVTLGTATLTTTGTGANAVTTATLTTSTLPVGTDTVTATYPGNANYGSASPTATETVGQATPSATLTASPATGDTFGAPVVLTETVTPINGACPTSTVTFASGGTTLGTATFPATPTGNPAICTASVTTTALPVGTDTVTATAPAAGSFGPISSSITESVAAASGANDTLTANPTSTAFGSPVTLTFTVPTVAGASAPPTGTVTFSNGTTTLGTATLTTTGTGANAVTTATLTTSALPVGTDTVTANYPGNANYAAANPAPTATVTVGQATANATLTASPATGDTFGAPVVLTETVTPINGACPTSTVTFASGGTTLGTAIFPATPTGNPATCTATFTTTALPVGTDTVTATAPAGGSFGAISSTTTETVATASGANDTLTANPTSSSFGDPVLLTFTVPAVAGASAPPTGTVTFTSGGVTLGTATLTTVGSGANATTTATLTTSTLPVGTDTITAAYPGNANYAAANPAPTATEVVGPASATGTLSATPGSGDTFGAPVTLTETIAPINGVCPTTTVTFASGGVTLGTGTFTGVPAGNPTSCVATTTTTALPIGTDTVTATAPAGGSFGAISSSTTETVAVASGANDTLTANPASSAFGSPVQLTFTVPTVAGASASPTGTVTFTSGGVTLGSATLTTTGTGANAVTTATLSTSALPVGTDTITATYPGNANYGAANPAPTATETVTQGAANGNLTVSPATGDTYGSPVTLTETVAPINGVCPTATVTFTSGGSTLGTGTFTPAPATGTPTSCVATTTTSALPVGTDTITATAPAGGSFGPISSSATETVGVAAGSGDTLSANPTTSNFGSPVVLTFTIPTVAGATATPTGTVTFTSGGVTLGTATLTTTGTGANAVTTATLTTSALPVGSDTVTASYPGNTDYGSGTATTTETVSPASASGTLTASPATGDTFGSPVTLTETIAPINGVCPSATVTFASGGTTLGTGTFTGVPAGNPTSCVATTTTSALPVGTDSITATAPAGGSFGPISSATTEAVGVASGSGDTLTANPTASSFGAPVVLTFTVPTVAGASAPPTGTVTFTNGSTTLGTATLTTTGSGANAVTTATLTTSVLPVGTDTVTATYPGNANYGSGSATANETVNQATSTGTLTASPATGDTFGSPVTLTETIAPINGVCPTATVTFASGGTTLGTGTFAAVPAGNPTSCVATTTTSALPVGTDTITATAPAAGSFGAIASTTTETVATASGAGDTLTANPASSTFGSPVVLTFTVPTVVGASAPPTGTVTFTSGGVTLGTGTLTTTGTGANAVTTATLTTSVLPVGTDAISATYPGNTNYGSGTGTATETVNPASATGTLSASPATGDTFGSPVTLTETIAPINGVCPSATVTFASGGTTLGTGTFTGVPAGNPTSCVAMTTTSALPVGTDSITATAPAGGSFGPISSSTTEAVGVASGSGDTLTANPASSTFGAPVVLTFTIPTVAGASAPPTGTVTFTNGSTTLGTATLTTTGSGANAVTTATLTTSALPVGTDTVTATYPGNANYSSGSATANETVNQATSTGTLTASPSTGDVYGGTVTLTETIAPINGVCPTAAVTFTSGGATLGTGTFTAVPAGNPTSCVATTTTTALPVGTDTVTATAPAAGNFGAISSTATETVAAASGTSDTLTLNPATSTFGSPIVLTFTVPPVAGASAPPTGTVTFTNGTTTLGTGTLSTTNGVTTATLTTSALPVGTDTVTATYAGNSSYGAASPTATETVTAVSGASDTLTANPTTSVFGSPVVLTFTVPTVSGASAPATGIVTFTNGTTTLGTGTLSTTNGVTTATLTTSVLPVGTDTVTATYAGDGNYGSASPTATETVTPATASGTLSASPATGDTFGSPVTLTETIAPINGVCPTATVTFASGGTTLGTGTFTGVPAGNPTSCVATTTTSALPVGTDSITATAPAGGSFGPISSSTTETVAPAASTGMLVVQPTAPIYGTPATLTETVLPVNGVCPTGTVTFSDGGVTLGTGTFTPVPATGTPTSCVATTTTSALPSGTSTITATYPGNGNFGPITSTTSVTVAPASSSTDTLTATPASSVVGTPVTLTFTIPPVAGASAPPSGTVTFSAGGTTLGTATLTTVNGVTTATITTSALPLGSNTVTATYTGNGNYGAATLTTTVAVVPNDFQITATPPNQTVNPGDTTTYTVSLSGLLVPFNSPVTLTATGLPPGATVTFANPTYVPGTGPTSTTMTIVTSPTQALLKHTTGGGTGIYYGLLLLPLLGVRRVRRKLRALPKGLSYCLAAMAMLGGLTMMTGCGGGYFGPAPQTYTITVTGTSGTLVHSTTVTLTVR